MEQVATKIAEFKEDDEVQNMDFSPDGNQLAVTTFLTLHIHLWHWQGHSHIERTLMKPRGTAGYTDLEGVRYSPNGAFLAVTNGLSSNEDGASVIQVFNPSTGALVTKIAEPEGGGGESRIAFAPDSRFLIRTYDAFKPPGRFQFLVHSTVTWEVVWGLNTLPLDVMALAISPDGSKAAIGGLTLGPGVINKAQIQIIDLVHRQVSRVIDEALPGFIIDKLPVSNQIECLAWSVDGNYVAASGKVGGTFSGPDAVRVFDAATGNIVASEQYEDTNVAALRYTPNGKYLIEDRLGKIGDARVRIWDGQHKTLLQEIPIHDSYALAVSRDSRYLAMSDRRTVTVWSLK